MPNPFELSGAWYRGNVHTHTDRSDGSWSVADCCAFYRGRGYDFLAITDHWTITDASAFAAPGFLLVPGAELDGWTEPAVPGLPGVQHHVVALGLRHLPPRERAATLQGTVAAIREAGGLPIVAHPAWSRQRAEHIAGTSGVGLIEVYNATSEIRDGRGLSTGQWDALLGGGEPWWALASDDTHLLPGFDDRAKAWITVRAPELSTDALLAAIAAGHFWSTTGPALHDLRIAPEAVAVETSPCRSLRLIADGVEVAAGGDGTAPIAHACLPLPTGWGWCRVECDDGTGGRAWSPPVFRAELPPEPPASDPA